MASKQSRITAEFLVEPFVEASPGPHVDAALKAFANAGLEVELGPFSSSTDGNIEEIADAVAEMIRSSMRAGATSVRLQIGADGVGLNGIGSLQHALTDMVSAVERDLQTPAGGWDRAQKQAAVRILNERGAFLLRGAVDDIAEIMGVSRITIYNYLNAIDASDTTE